MKSETIAKILKAPKNMGTMKNPDGVGKVELNVPHCTDKVFFYIKVKEDKIVDAKFEAFACTPALVTSSVATELAKGMTIKEAQKLSKYDIAKEIGGFPPPLERACYNIGTDALRAAINDYLRKK